MKTTSLTHYKSHYRRRRETWRIDNIEFLQILNRNVLHHCERGTQIISIFDMMVSPKFSKHNIDSQWSCDIMRQVVGKIPK